MPGAAPAFAKAAAGKSDVAALLYFLGMDSSLPRLAPFGKLRTSPFGKSRRAAMPAQGQERRAPRRAILAHAAGRKTLA
jgi:hypothetical protein